MIISLKKRIHGSIRRKVKEFYDKRGMGNFTLKQTYTSYIWRGMWYCKLLGLVKKIMLLVITLLYSFLVWNHSMNRVWLTD